MTMTMTLHLGGGHAGRGAAGDGEAGAGLGCCGSVQGEVTGPDCKRGTSINQRRFKVKLKLF